MPQEQIRVQFCTSKQNGGRDYIRGGTQKFPELLKIYLKYLYKFQNLVPFEVLPLRLDAAIPVRLPMPETLSKIFNGNAVKGRQRFAGGP